MGELEVVVDIEVTHRIQSEGILAEVELCISEQELEGAESLMCPEESSETFTVRFALHVTKSVSVLPHPMHAHITWFDVVFG